MANKKISELDPVTSLENTDLVPVVTDLATTPKTNKIKWENIKNLLKASASDINTGTEDNKYITPKAIADSSYIKEVVEDTTPELGGELDCGAHSIGFTQQAATGDGTTTIDWKLGNKFKFTFGAQAETFTFTAPSNPCNLVLMMVQDGTGSRTATFPTTVKWAGGTAPTLTTAGNGVDIISFYYDGSYYHGVASLAFAVPA